MEAKTKENWASGDAYDRFMGRWSRLIAPQFLSWLSPKHQVRWLDVGCGSGVLSEAIIRHYEPVELIAVDQSEGFLATARRRLTHGAICKVGNAFALPVETSSIDYTVSALLLNFLPAPEKALTEMTRVTAKSGTVAAYVWDYAGKMELLNFFWDEAVKVDPNAAKLHEANRFPQCNPDDLSSLFVRAGLKDVDTAALAITTRLADFADYWEPFLGGQGPAPTYLMEMEASARTRLRTQLEARLGHNSICLYARAWAVKGDIK